MACQGFLVGGTCVSFLVGGNGSPLWGAVKCHVMSLRVSMGLAWLWTAHLLMLRVVFLFLWIISMGILHWILLVLGWS